jgi:RecB family exonuclease
MEPRVLWTAAQAVDKPKRRLAELDSLQLGLAHRLRTCPQRSTTGFFLILKRKTRLCTTAGTTHRDGPHP